MKIALLLSMACAALVFSGCSTERGGAGDTYDTSSGTVESSPVMSDPSLPQDSNVGPQTTPP